MARWRRRKKNDASDDIFRLFIGVGLLVLFSSGGLNLTHSQAPSDTFKTIVPLFVIVLLLLVVFIFFINYVKKLERREMVQKQKHINDWFSMTPESFEHFVAGVYEKEGFTLKEVTRYVGDHGIDVSLEKEGKKFAVQVKQNRNWKTSEKDLREFYGSYISQGFDGGFFVTTSRFTYPAKMWARSVGITLVDRDDLAKKVNK